MISLDLGDPTLLSVGVVQTQNIPQATVRLAVWNDSPCVLLIQFPDRFQRIPSGTARLFEIEAGQVQLQWSVESVIAVTTSLYSKLTWECYKQQDPIPETYPIQIIRQQGSTGLVIANELGTTADGVTIRTPPLGISSGFDTIYPYNQGVTGPIRGLQFDVLGASGELQGLQITGVDGNTHVINGLFVSNASSLDAGFLLTDGAGHVSEYGGETTQGAGVPPIEKVTAASTSVAVTTDQTIVTYTPPANAVLLCMMRFRLNNGTSGQTVKAYALYTDADSGATPTDYFPVMGSGLTALTIAGGVASLVNLGYVGTPLLIFAKGGQPVTLHYQDPGGTPSDQVTAAIIRLS